MIRCRSLFRSAAADQAEVDGAVGAGLNRSGAGSGSSGRSEEDAPGRLLLQGDGSRLLLLRRLQASPTGKGSALGGASACYFESSPWSQTEPFPVS